MYQFSRIRGVVELSDGRIVVANDGSAEIRCYTRDGRYLWSSGRRGDGPGDFRNITRLARYRGDSLLVYDTRRWLSSYSVIAPDGIFARSWTPADPDDSTHYLLYVGTWNDGTVAIRSSAIHQPQTRPRVIRFTTRLFRYDATGHVMSRLGAVLDDEYYEGEGYGVAPLPYKRGSHFATTADALFVGTDDTYEIRRFRKDGSLEAILQRDVPLHQLAPDEVTRSRERLRLARRSHRDTLFRGMPSALLARITASEEKMYDELPVPPSYPAYGDLVAGRDGTLWVKVFDPAAERDTTGQQWSVFHPDGRWLGDVRLPPRFTLYEATNDHLLGVQTDNLGVEFVRIFRIE